MVLTDEFAGLCLMYSATHGEEDRKHAENPKEQSNIVEIFNHVFNDDE